MDRKSISILVLCFGLLLLWPRLVSKMFPPKPLPLGVTNNVAATISSADTNAIATATTNMVSSPASNAPAASVAFVAPRPLFDTNAPEQTLVISNANARYTFTSRGGGLKQVELLRYPETVTALRKKKVTGAHEVAKLNESAPAPIGALLDDGTAQGDGVFELTPTATGGVHAEKVLASGLRVTKDFELGTNYLVATTVRIQNGGAQPIVLPSREIVVGTATPLGPNDKGLLVGASWYDGVKASTLVNAMWFANRKFGCVPGVPHTEFREGDSNVVWAAVQNQFFTLTAMPEKPAQQVIVKPVDLPRDPETPANLPTPHGYEAALGYSATTLAPGQSVEQKINLFAGPKEYRTLARVSDGFNNNVDLVMGYGGFFGGFARALLLAMNWLHDFLRLPYGWAIIAITVIIKTLFWPLTAASTRSMKRMQALQPQMNAIKEKYKDDAAKMNKKTMEFMKENKVNPVGGCLPMLIQLPIFIGFYRMIQSAIELRGAPFLWIGDLSQPDTLFIIHGLGAFPFIGVPGVGLPINLLPLIMGATQLWQISLTPPSPGMDASQQKLMKYMPLMFLVILYNFSAGLTLYWTAQNLLTIAQTKLTKTVPVEVPVKKI